MFCDGEVELRDLIMENLESCGFLSKIKAELRAGVILACEGSDLRKEIPLFNKKFNDFMESSNAKLMVSIVREFLEYFNLNFTLSVFEPEIASNSLYFNRSELCNKLNINNSEFDGPVLSSLLKLHSKEAAKFPSKINSESMPHPIVTNATKSLETIAEDVPFFEKSDQETITTKDISSSSVFTIANLEKSDSSSKIKSINGKNGLTKKANVFETSDKAKLSKNSLVEIPNAETINDSDANSIFKNNSSFPDDNFFDTPLPSENKSYFNLSSENSSLNSYNTNSSVTADNHNSLSSLKDLPAFTEKSNWPFDHEVNKQLPRLKKETNEIFGKIRKNESDKDIESNEDVSDKHNSDESIEEEIEEEYSDGVDNLLNSLSLGDDATSDQTVSQASVVDGVDHLESLK